MASDSPVWRAAKSRYLLGGISYAGVAAEFGLSPDAVEKAGATESWAKQKREFGRKVSDQLADSAAAEVVSATSAGAVWTALERRQLLREIGTREGVKDADRIRAILADAALDPQSTEVQGIQHDDTPTRFVIRRSSDARP